MTFDREKEKNGLMYVSVRLSVIQVTNERDIFICVDLKYNITLDTYCLSEKFSSTLTYDYGCYNYSAIKIMMKLRINKI